MNCFSRYKRVPRLGSVYFFPRVLFHSRVTRACPATTELIIMRVNVKTTTTTTTTTTALEGLTAVLSSRAIGGKVSSSFTLRLLMSPFSWSLRFFHEKNGQDKSTKFQRSNYSSQLQAVKPP